MPSDWTSFSYWSSTSTDVYQPIFQYIGEMFEEEEEPKKHLGFADYLEKK